MYRTKLLPQWHGHFFGSAHERPRASLASLCLLLSFLLLHLFLDNAGCLLRCDLLEHVLHLEHPLVVDWLVDLTEQCPIPDHSLRELYVGYCGTTEMVDDVLDEDERLVFHVIQCVSLGQQHLDDGLDRWQREGRSAQALDQVVDRSEDQHQGHLVVWVQLWSRLGLLEALAGVLHELVVEEIYAYG